MRTDSALLLEAKPQPQEVFNELNMRDYYRGLIQDAIQHGGVYNGQQISIPWLRMTLSGLEMRPVPPEMMWETKEPVAAEMPGYAALFPEEKV